MLGIEDPRSLLEICKSSRTQFMLASSLELLSNDECKKKKLFCAQSYTFLLLLSLVFCNPFCLFFRSETNNAQCHG